MATRKRKSIPQPLIGSARVPLTITIAVPKPRNRLAVNALLKKSSVHADRRRSRERDGELDVKQDINDALSQQQRKGESQDQGADD